MLRSYFLVIAPVMAFGCSSAAERPQRDSAPPSGASPAVSLPAAQPATVIVPDSEALPGSIFADFERAAAPMKVTWDSMVLALRADSGTARADSDFVRFQSALNGDLVAVNHVAFDHSVEELFHRDWRSDSMQAKYLRAHRIPNDAAAQAIVDSIERLLSTRSIETQDGEGGPTFTVDQKALSKAVGHFLSPATREYLVFTLVVQSHPAADDGYLKISWREFADRLAMMDHFVATYPTNQFSPDLRLALVNEMRLYLQGSEALDAAVPELTPEATENIRYFLAKFGSTPAAAVVRGYRDALAAQGYRGGKTLDEYIAKLPQR